MDDLLEKKLEELEFGCPYWHPVYGSINLEEQKNLNLSRSHSSIHKG